MNDKTKFPYENPEQYGDVQTVADRAGVELQGEEGIPFHCGERMHVKSGILGPDYAKCETCGLLLYNAASPHVNGGIVWKEDVLDKFGDGLWTTMGGPERGPEWGPGNPLPTFGSIREFYSDNRTRETSPEADYGVHWKRGGAPAAHRVSYVRDTGEVYAVGRGDPDEPVIVLGTFPIDPDAGPTDVYYLGLDQLLNGWPDHCGAPGGLEWVQARLETAARNRTP